MVASLGLSLLCCLLICAASNGQPKTTRMLHKGDGVRIDPGGQVEFPSELDLEIIIDGELPVVCTAGKLPGAHKPMTAVDSENKQAARSRHIEQVKEFYVDDTGSYEMTSVTNEDGTVTTNVRGVVRPRPGRKCWMSHGQTQCWDVKMDGKYDNGVHLLYRPTNIPSPDAEHTSGGRSKRAPSYEDYLPSKVVEIVYIVDKAMVDWFMLIYDDNETIAIDDMTAYINMMNNEATFMYGSIKKSVNLDIQLMGVVLLYPTVRTEWSWMKPHKKGDTLDVGNWPKGVWKSYETWAEDGNLDEYQFDIAAVVSGLDLSSDNNLNALGRAPYSTVCNSDISVGKKVLFNEDLYDDAVLTFVHELAHSLSALHDGIIDNCDPNKYLMAPAVLDVTSSNKKTYRTFSKCTAIKIKAHLDRYPDCLSDHNDTQYLENLCKGVRGDRFSVDFNCRKAFRIKNSTFCGPSSAVTQGKVPARACWDDAVISCTDANGNCNKKLYNMFDGTPCKGKNNVCYKGSCIEEYELCPPECTCEGKKGKAKKKCCAASKNIDGTCCTSCRLSKNGKRCIK